LTKLFFCDKIFVLEHVPLENGCDREPREAENADGTTFGIPPNALKIGLSRFE
jgi:hypothetical protein